MFGDEGNQPIHPQIEQETMDGHHLILGETVDYLTGNVVTDTHDERYRQKIGHLLIDSLKYKKSEITPRSPLTISAGPQKATIIVDFIIKIDDKIGMVIKYGPGSLTTRHTPAIAIANLVAGYRVPIVVVTNGEDAEIIETDSDKILARGLDQIPTQPKLARILRNHTFPAVSPKKREMAARIVYCYEIDGACPCDTTICRLDETDSNSQDNIK